MNNQMVLILGMMFVTYIPRLLPFVIVSEKKLPKRLNKFLQFIPYAALGALIAPGGLFAIPNNPWASSLGMGFAFVYAWYKGGIIIPVLGSIVVAFLVLLIQNGFVFL